MSKYDLEEIIHQMQKDYAKYGSFADTLAKLDPLFKYFKATESLALYLKNTQKNL